MISGSCWSGKRDLNPRLRPWQGRTLPLSYSRSIFQYTHCVLFDQEKSNQVYNHSLARSNGGQSARCVNLRTTRSAHVVTPANPGSQSGAGSGVHKMWKRLDSGLRRNDGLSAPLFDIQGWGLKRARVSRRLLRFGRRSDSVSRFQSLITPALSGHLLRPRPPSLLGRTRRARA